MNRPRLEQTTNTYTVLRHGKTKWNIEKRYAGSSNVDLSPIGEEEARQVVLPSDLKAAFISPLNRTRQTAALVPGVDQLHQHIDARLREKNGGLAEGLTFAEIQALYPEAWNAWSTGNLDTILNARFPEGESEAEVIDRITEFLRFAEDMYQNMNVLVVAHAGVHRAFQFALGIPWEQIYSSESIKNSTYSTFPPVKVTHR